MSDHPSIPLLWASCPSSPSGVIQLSSKRPCGNVHDNGAGRKYWRVRASVEGKMIQPLAHRVLWLLTYGTIPDDMTVDHIDNNGLNNSLSNLRLASKSEQARNRKVMSHSRTCFKGVKRTPAGTFEARVCVDGKRYYLGTFPTIKEAHQAYCAKAVEIHGLFHRP